MLLVQIGGLRNHDARLDARARRRPPARSPFAPVRAGRDRRARPRRGAPHRARRRRPEPAVRGHRRDGARAALRDHVRLLGRVLDLARRLPRDHGVQQRRLRALERQPDAVRDGRLGVGHDLARGHLRRHRLPCLARAAPPAAPPDALVAPHEADAALDGAAARGRVLHRARLRMGERRARSGPLDPAGKLLAAFFQGVQPRTAGFNTVDYAQMDESTLLFQDVLMFVGAGKRLDRRAGSRWRRSRCSCSWSGRRSGATPRSTSSAAASALPPSGRRSR